MVQPLWTPTGSIIGELVVSETGTENQNFPYKTFALPAFLYKLYRLKTALNNKGSHSVSVVPVKRMAAEDKRLFFCLTSGPDCQTPLCPGSHFHSILMLDLELEIFQ